MGTSSARQAPVGKLWRAAKTAASRFASGQGASPPQASEVIARYRAALHSLFPQAEGEAGIFLPEVVQTAAALGNFYRQWEENGWEAALISLGVEPVPAPAFEALLPRLLDRLAGPGATLDEAVTRLALLQHGRTFLAATSRTGPPSAADSPQCPGSLAGVSNFLGLVFYQKMLADLGEPLEYHAPTIYLQRERQAQLQARIMAAAEAAADGLLAPDGSFSPDRLEAGLEKLLIHLGEWEHG